MDVIVERFQRRKIVSNPASPMLYYLRQKPKTCGTVDIDVLAASIQKNCAMTKGDVKHVIEALVEEIQGNLANGDKVKLNQLGTFHMTFRCPGMEASDKCTVRNISKVNIRFIPDKELKLVNGSTAVTRSPANVGFVLDKPEEGGWVPILTGLCSTTLSLTRTSSAASPAAAIKAVVPEAAPATTATRAKIRWDKEGMIKG